MSRYPGATWRPVDRYQPGGSAHRSSFTARRLILHTAVSNATPSMFSFFAVSGRATPHFYVGRGGEVEQYIDTAHGSSANLDGNHDCVTVETWDGYGATWNGGGDGPRWTDEQVEALARLAAWCNAEHGIPLERLPSSKPGTRGVGWHRLGCDGNYEQPDGQLLGGRVAGGELWSSSPGKVCPTTTRIRQTVNEVIPRAVEIATGDDMPTPEEYARAVWNFELGAKDNRRKARSLLLQSANASAAVRAAIGDLPDEVAAAVEAALPADPGSLTRDELRNLVRNAARSGSAQTVSRLQITLDTEES